MSKQIVHGNTIPSLIREAFRVAQGERPGAVLLELPEDIAAEETTEPALKPHPRHYAVAGDTVLTEAVELIRAANMPLLLGQGPTANTRAVRSTSL